jgi:hypothetical protein
MALSFATVGAKITASFINAVIALVNRQGLTSVIPTSVVGTGATLAAGGTVTVSTGGSSVSVNGCFTSAYDNYLVKIKINLSSSAVVNVRLRVAGVDAAGAADYVQSVIGVGGTASAVTSPTTSSISADTSTATDHRISLDLWAPADAENTYFGTPNVPNSTGGWAQVGGRHILSTAYDGFTILAGAGVINFAVIRVYGYNDN